jgi:hypothetical protein
VIETSLNPTQAARATCTKLSFKNWNILILQPQHQKDAYSYQKETEFHKVQIKERP